MCKIWSIIYGCHHKNNATLSTCNGRRKYANSTSQACMKYPTLRVHLAGNCAACCKHATDKRLDYESKVIEEYFANPPAYELRRREILEAERISMLEDVERRRIELTDELPLRNAVRDGKISDWCKTDPSKPWMSKRRANWRLSALANEVLPEYLAEPEPEWANNFVQEESADEREKREAEAAKLVAAGISDYTEENESDGDDGVWEVHDYTKPRDDDDVSMSSDSSDDLDGHSDDDEPAQYKDLDEDMEDHLTAPEPGADWYFDDGDSGFVSDNSDENETSEKTDLQSTNTTDVVDAMDWSSTEDYANFHSEARELNSSNTTTSEDFLTSSDSTSTSSNDFAQCPLIVVSDTDNSVTTNNPSTNATTARVNENIPAHPHTTPTSISIPDKPTSACLMEVEGVKYLVGERPEQANPWQWSRSASSPKTKSGRSMIIRW